MSEIYKGELQDDKGNAIYPHTADDCVFCDEGKKTLKQKIADLLGRIPTKLSQFTNDANYAKKEDIPTKLSQFTNDCDVVKDPYYVHTDNNFTNTHINRVNDLKRWFSESLVLEHIAITIDNELKPMQDVKINYYHNDLNSKGLCPLYLTGNISGGPYGNYVVIGGINPPIYTYSFIGIQNVGELTAPAGRTFTLDVMCIKTI